jgi:hypothetical protein
LSAETRTRARTAPEGRGRRRLLKVEHIDYRPARGKDPFGLTAPDARELYGMRMREVREWRRQERELWLAEGVDLLLPVERLGSYLLTAEWEAPETSERWDAKTWQRCGIPLTEAAPWAAMEVGPRDLAWCLAEGIDAAYLRRLMVVSVYPDEYWEHSLGEVQMLRQFEVPVSKLTGWLLVLEAARPKVNRVKELYAQGLTPTQALRHLAAEQADARCHT